MTYNEQDNDVLQRFETWLRDEAYIIDDRPDSFNHELVRIYGEPMVDIIKQSCLDYLREKRQVEPLYTQLPVISLPLKPGHVLIKLREGEEYATDNQESI